MKLLKYTYKYDRQSESICLILDLNVSDVHSKFDVIHVAIVAWP